jgi:hypothetical protein
LRQGLGLDEYKKKEGSMSRRNDTKMKTEFGIRARPYLPGSERAGSVKGLRSLKGSFSINQTY